MFWFILCANYVSLQAFNNPSQYILRYLIESISRKTYDFNSKMILYTKMLIFLCFFLLTKSIEEQNFRYTGARLCRLLDSVDPTANSLFRRLLCFKLQYNDAELIQYMSENETHKVRNTTLFLAELYIQLQNVSFINISKLYNMKSKHYSHGH